MSAQNYFMYTKIAVHANIKLLYHIATVIAETMGYSRNDPNSGD